jgi:hypothetical protein
MKTLKIGIASYKDMKARTMAIAQGKLKPKPGDPKVTADQKSADSEPDPVPGLRLDFRKPAIPSISETLSCIVVSTFQCQSD